MTKEVFISLHAKPYITVEMGPDGKTSEKWLLKYGVVSSDYPLAKGQIIHQFDTRRELVDFLMQGVSAAGW